MTRTCGVAAAVLAVAEARVTIWPGWSVPLAAVILATVLAVLAISVAALVAALAARSRRPAVPCCGRCPAARRDIPVLSVRLEADRPGDGAAT